MTALRGLALLLLLQAVGEGLASAPALPIDGAVLGVVLLDLRGACLINSRKQRSPSSTSE